MKLHEKIAVGVGLYVETAFGYLYRDSLHSFCKVKTTHFNAK